MAVHTHVSNEQLRHFLRAYDLGTPRTFKGIAEGIENSNFVLETTRGSYILTLFEKRVGRDDLPYFLGIMRHLVDKGFPAAAPVADTRGQALKSLAGRPAMICTFLPGLSFDAPDDDACRTIGAGLARLHAALADFVPRRHNDLSVEAWPRMVAGLEAHTDRLQAGLSEQISADLAVLASDWPRGLPSGTIHADLFPDNALFLDGGLSGVIDFYFACSDVLAYDIAVCLNAWCFTADGGALDTSRAGALLDGYQHHRRLDAAELDALPLLARGAAMRFFVTRLIDAARGPADGAVVTIKDPLDYARRLAFHRHARSLADYGVSCV